MNFNYNNYTFNFNGLYDPNLFVYLMMQEEMARFEAQEERRREEERRRLRQVKGRQDVARLRHDVSPHLPGINFFWTEIFWASCFMTFEICEVRNYTYEQMKVVAELISELNHIAATSKLNKVREIRDAADERNLIYDIDEVDGHIEELGDMIREIEAIPNLRERSPDEEPVNVILDLWAGRPQVFVAEEENVVYLCKRAISKEFTEHVLSRIAAGLRINAEAIWTHQTFASQMIAGLTSFPFNIVSVGSYSLIIRYYNPNPADMLETIALGKKNSGTDHDVKIIGRTQEEHRQIYQQIRNFIYGVRNEDDLVFHLGLALTGSEFMPSRDVFDALDAEHIQFHGYDFDHFLPPIDNLFLSRKIRGPRGGVGRTELFSARMPNLDPRVALSITHVEKEIEMGDRLVRKEFIVFRFKYTRRALVRDDWGTEHVISAKVCFLDLSICGEYDDSYMTNNIPREFGRQLNASRHAVERTLIPRDEEEKKEEEVEEEEEEANANLSDEEEENVDIEDRNDARVPHDLGHIIARPMVRHQEAALQGGARRSSRCDTMHCLASMVVCITQHSTSIPSDR